MKGRKPAASRFRKAFMAAATILALGTGSVSLDNLPKDPATDTQTIVTFNIGAEDQYGYNISPIDQFWKHTLSMKSEAQMNAALLSAAAEADSWRTRALIEQGLDMAKYGDRALIVAAGNGANDVVKVLLAANVAAGAQNSAALIAAAEGNHTDVALTLIKAGASSSAQQSAALIAAAGHGNTVLVQAMLNDGAGADAQNNAALMAAIVGGHTQVADALLDAKKMVTMTVPYAPPVYDFDHLGMSTFDYNNPFDMTPRMGGFGPGDHYGPPFYPDFSLRSASVDAINVNANNGEALYQAVFHNNADMVRVLLQHGADVNARDGAIKQLANESRNIEMVNLLNGKTPTASTSFNLLWPNGFGP
jgi:ankyrin repeat protein